MAEVLTQQRKREIRERLSSLLGTKVLGKLRGPDEHAEYYWSYKADTPTPNIVIFEETGPTLKFAVNTYALRVRGKSKMMLEAPPSFEIYVAPEELEIALPWIVSQIQKRADIVDLSSCPVPLWPRQDPTYIWTARAADLLNA